MGSLEFHSTCKILSAVNLKHSSFWPAADGTPMSSDLRHAVPDSACLLSLYYDFDGSVPV
jgi:hypothetical protein